MKELNEKNSVRAKFGLDPIGEEEFKKLREENGQLQSEFERKLKMQQQQQREGEAAMGEKKSNFFSKTVDKIKQSVEETKCETSLDCPEGLNCCDFIFAKVCCSSGMGIHVYPPEGIVEAVPALVPVDDSDNGVHGRGGGSYGGKGRGPW